MKVCLNFEDSWAAQIAQDRIFKSIKNLQYFVTLLIKILPVGKKRWQLLL